MFISDIRNRDRDTVYIDAESGSEISLMESYESDKMSKLSGIAEAPAIYNDRRETAGIREWERAADTTDSLRTGMRYLTASLVIAAAAAVYGLFSHGVYSYYMTYAFMIPLIGGAMPHLIAALKGSERQPGALFSKILGAKDLQIAVIATLTAGSLLKGALDIYGTTNRLLIAYPVIAALLILLALIFNKAETVNSKNRA